MLFKLHHVQSVMAMFFVVVHIVDICVMCWIGDVVLWNQIIVLFSVKLSSRILSGMNISSSMANLVIINAH